MSQQSLLVIDGNSLIHRAFHAIAHLSTSRGESTNAVYGFVNMLLKILEDRKPAMVAVCFDKGKLNFRHRELESYKGTRKATPEELRPQFPLVKEFLAAMEIPVFELDDYEADDLIGTLVTLAEKEKIKSLILTGDQDVLQLVSPLTKVLLTKRGITQLDEYDQEKIKERYGLTPEQLVDLKGLTGDVSDNIPGVPGIGEKTGVKLIGEFESLENLLQNFESTGTRIAEKLKEYSDQALLSKRLALIDRQAPIEVDFSCCLWQGPDYDRLLPLFSRLEFNSLIKAITGKLQKKQSSVISSDVDAQPDPAVSSYSSYQVEYTILTQAPELYSLIERLKGSRIGLVFAGDRIKGLEAAAISLSDRENYFISLESQELLAAVKNLAEAPEIEKVCFDAKAEIWKLARHQICLAGLFLDIMVASYLINPGNPNRRLSDLTLEHLGSVLPSGDLRDICAWADATRKLAPLLEEKIKQAEMEGLYYQVENPLIGVLADMEMAGVKVDGAILAEMSLELGQRLEVLARDIYKLAGEEFNINSPKQLGNILFERLNLPIVKKTKTGYSTDAQVLEELADCHEIIGHIINYRQLMKLKSTYVDGFTPLIDPATGLVHTTFQQSITATGRLSSTEPNLQNIPIRLEEGRRIRKVFTPRQKDNMILAADYSQIELRIMAHLSQDPLFQEAFRQEQDIHTRTASEVFGVPLEEVTSDLRDRAKAVNFGIIYGISDFGLSRDIKVPRKEAGKYIDNYFLRYKGAKDFIDRTIAQAKDKGYVTTILGRRRYLPDLFSSNKMIRSFGERTATNTPIQGSAADIIKLAMVNIARELSDRGLKTIMVLQVHDELIFDVPQSELEEVKALVREKMENAVTLSVPLTVDLKVGKNWYEVKKI
ncbi:MAG: DNA polymerase I [Peptococcaceae bacterium]|nr:DNA polymerase I [Peptococcaceae bacterium]